LQMKRCSARQEGDCPGQFVWISRFRHVFLITGIESALAVRLTRICCECNRRRLSAMIEAVGADFADKAVTVLTGHSDVSHEDGRPELIQCSEGLRGGGGSAYSCATVCEFRGENFAIVGTVFDYKDPQALQYLSAFG